MKFLLLLYENEQRWNEGYPQAELAEYRIFGKENASAIQGGNALQSTSTAATVKVRNGETMVTDGPYAETKEQLGGYYLIEAKDRDEAVAIAAKIGAIVAADVPTSIAATVRTTARVDAPAAERTAAVTASTAAPLRLNRLCAQQKNQADGEYADRHALLHFSLL